MFLYFFTMYGILEKKHQIARNLLYIYIDKIGLNGAAYSYWHHYNTL